MADEEDKYIKQTENEQVARIRRERQLAALRQEEAAGIKAVLRTNDEVAAEALELGFDREAARILHLVPVIQVAWADGEIQTAERAKILEMAASRGVGDGPALEFLELLLSERPSNAFFERTNHLITQLLADDASGRDSDDLLERARAVASAAGGIFGFGTISGPEKELLEELAAMLKR